jgi:uncharacterized protein YndB with AHSA1/START domain
MTMARQLRPVTLDFADAAPVRLRFAARTDAPPAAVFRALAEETEDWPTWFTAVVAAAPTPDGRTVRLKGGARFRETVLAAEQDTRFAYRTDETNAPGPRALLEDWQLTGDGTGTQVRWAIATDGASLYRSVLRLARPALGRVFRDAVRTLDRRLAAGPNALP